MAEATFLLDSNICIYILRDAASAPAIRVQQCAPGEVVTSSVVYAEVVRGLDPADADSRAIVDGLFRWVAVQPFDRSAAEAYTHIPFRRGRFDRLIAAHALALDLTIVTANEADFADIPRLRVENWTRL
ncbi:type II toxin-antitoxin system VapC family toxin [Sphingomonas sp.]|uniref:type II toxin-antitoxin system VapC family toxin n=1 Tax=Sphingomonas sp. TaxID=28214 RepID=UPI003B3A0017